jgi:DNA-binding transcriptional MerR regulator
MALAGSEPRTLVGISAAAERTGVSERALRYYQQLGLITPSCTAGGFRRYTDADLARVDRIKELQSLLGLDLDEIADVMRYEDRAAEIRTAYYDNRTRESQRRKLVGESLVLHEELRSTVHAKRNALDQFLTDLDLRITRIQDALQDPPGSRPGSRRTR